MARVIQRGWRWWWGIGVPVAFLAGCVTRPVLEPLPCQRIEELPAVMGDLEAMRAQELADGRPFYRAIRHYAVQADADCAGNRVLRGELEGADAPAPWWRRFWRWITGGGG